MQRASELKEGGQPIGCADDIQTSLYHDGDAIAQLHGLIDVVGYHQHGPCLLVDECVEALPELRGGNRIEGRSGLIQKEQ